jgi:hypothetical protein
VVPQIELEVRAGVLALPPTHQLALGTLGRGAGRGYRYALSFVYLKTSAPNVEECNVATATQQVQEKLPPLIRWKYSWIFVAGIVLTIFTVNAYKFMSQEASLWLLNWVHVFFGLAWTGIDLFMGFLLGPILGRLSPLLRRTVSQELSARFFWIFPMLATVTPTAGWELAARLGYLECLSGALLGGYRGH